MTDLQHTQRHPWLAKVFGYALLGFVRLLTGAQARWYGSPPKAEQRIYFANHQSHADLVMIWAALPEELRSITRPIAARDYWTKSDFTRWITTAVFNAAGACHTMTMRAPVRRALRLRSSRNAWSRPCNTGRGAPPAPEHQVGRAF